MIRRQPTGYVVQRLLQHDAPLILLHEHQWLLAVRFCLLYYSTLSFSLSSSFFIPSTCRLPFWWKISVHTSFLVIYYVVLADINIALYTPSPFTNDSCLSPSATTSVVTSSPAMRTQKADRSPERRARPSTVEMAAASSTPEPSSEWDFEWWFLHCYRNFNQSEQNS